MELLEKYFAELIQCVDASYLVIGIILVFLSVPDTADYAPYRKAKYFLASQGKRIKLRCPPKVLTGTLHPSLPSIFSG